LSDAPEIAAALPFASPAEPGFPVAARLTSRDVFRLLARAWPFIRPYKRHLGYLFLLTLPALPAGLFGLMMIRVLFDVVGHGAALTTAEARMLFVTIGATREQVLRHACIVGGAALLAALPYAAFMFGYTVWILQRITNLFRVNLYTRLQELSLRFHAEEKIGDAIFRMFQDSAVIYQVIEGLVIQPLHAVPFALANLVWLAMFNYRMAAIALALLPANFALAWYYASSLRRAFIGERETAAAATTRIEETLSSIKAVKAFGCETREGGRYARDNWDSFIAARRARLMLARYRVSAEIVRGTAYVGAIWLGASQVLAGGAAGLAIAAVSLGTFQGALAIFGRMSASTRRLADHWGALQDVVVAMSRVLEMLGKQSDEKMTSGTRIPPKTASSVVFDNVSFGYDSRTPVLTGVCFTARAGEITAIAGPSGAGKSSIIALLMRFFDPASGRILLDGVPIREFDLAAWRAMLSVALQENPLFTATIRSNITYGRSEATDQEIQVALERAGLAEFVRSLPAGLDTMLGEKGAKLSAGQAQRIGLARALLRDAPILLLDEPTSALDVATEEAVMRGIRGWLDERPGGRLVIIATHRRTTASRANSAYAIAGGRMEQLVEPASELREASET